MLVDAGICPYVDEVGVNSGEVDDTSVHFYTTLPTIE
jgi:hypothetical protein